MLSLCQFLGKFFNVKNSPNTFFHRLLQNLHANDLDIAGWRYREVAGGAYEEDSVHELIRVAPDNRRMSVLYRRRWSTARVLNRNDRVLRRRRFIASY